MLLIAGLIALIAGNVIMVSFTSKRLIPVSGMERFVVFMIAPFQDIMTRTIHSLRDIWGQYFITVGVAGENRLLRKALDDVLADVHHCRESELANARLRKLLNFQDTLDQNTLAARVIAKDPSPWFKTIIIDKGATSNLRSGLPVVVPGGIVGQVTDVSRNYAKVLLLIDSSSAADALVQRTRTRGIIRGVAAGHYGFHYVLHKHDLEIGDTIISSGLDGVFPKGLQIGTVSDIRRNSASIFQDVVVAPGVNYETLEEVMVILDSPRIEEAALP